MTPPQKLNAAPPLAHGHNVKRGAAVARPQTAEERRRAQRVLLKMPVIIHIPGKANPLHGFTHTVSASGAMIVLPEGIPMGTKLSVENPKTQKKVEAHVVLSYWIPTVPESAWDTDPVDPVTITSIVPVIV